MNPTLQLLCCAALATQLTAQIPTDSALILEDAPLLSPNFRLADVFGGGVTTVGNQAVFLVPPPSSVAADPTDAGAFFFLSGSSSFAGAWRSNVGGLAQIESSLWGLWLRVPGERIAVGATQVITLRGGQVEASVKQTSGTGQPVLLLQHGGAVDIAVVEPFVYVAANSGPLVEYDLINDTQRTVGIFTGVRSIAASPVAPELCLGTDSGQLVRIDAVSGAQLGSVTSGVQTIASVDYTRFGTLVYTDGQSVWSELSPAAPIYTSSTSIFDIGVGTGLAATATPFGAGCGLGAQTDWSLDGVPSLGNSAFAFRLENGVPSSFAVLAFGFSRLTSSVVGGPLPIDLQAAGAPGCQLLIDPLVFELQTTNASGFASYPLPIPTTPTLAGLEIDAQWFLPDAAIGPFGFGLTAGLSCVIR